MMMATTRSGVDARIRLRRLFVDFGVPGVVHPEVQPAGQQTGGDGQHQEHRRDRVAGDHRLLVEPRHPVVADVEPAVDARGRPRQHEQQRGDIQRQVAAAVQTDPREGERGDRAQRAGQSGEGAELNRPLRRRERQQQQPDRRSCRSAATPARSPQRAPRRAAAAPRSSRTGRAAAPAPRTGGSTTSRRCPRRSGSSTAGSPDTTRSSGLRRT